VNLEGGNLAPELLRNCRRHDVVRADFHGAARTMLASSFELWGAKQPGSKRGSFVISIRLVAPLVPPHLLS